MRYSPEHKEETRRKIVATAGTIAKQQGFGTTGVDALMGAAGLKGATFYHHFNTKSDLLNAIIEHELSGTRERIADGINTRQDLLRFLIGYMGTSHVDHPEAGCALPSLSSEVARAEVDVKETYEHALKEIQADMKQVLGNNSEAWAMLAMSVGAVSMARAMASEETKESILRACRKFCKEHFSTHE